jgi:SAM-dependent methyltransferase
VPAARQRALVFGEDAELYHRRRPGYPASLYADLLAAVPFAQRALEAGCGTGKATAELGRRGIEVVAVEPHPAMASMARRVCDGLPVEIRVGRFEDWEGPSGAFDLVVSAQAWHWIDAAAGLAVARRALRPGGVLATWWNSADRWEGPVRQALDDVYRRFAPELTETSIVNRRRTGSSLEAESRLEGFTHMEARCYRWAERYDAASYTELLRTHSDHRVLPSEQLEELLAAVAKVVEDVARGSITYPYRADLLLARRS